MVPSLNLVPNLKTKAVVMLATIVIGFIGLFEQRTKFVLNDGTTLSGHVKAREPDHVMVELASGSVRRIDTSRIQKESWFNFEVDLNLGLDLRGGTQLRYQLDLSKQKAEERQAVLDTTVETFKKRLDTLGVKEISVVGSPPDQILIDLPGVTMEESQSYEQVIQSLGSLRFLIRAESNPAAGLNLTDEQKRLADYLKELKDKGTAWTPRSLDLSKFDVKGTNGMTYRWFPWSEKALAEHEGSAEFPFELLEIDDNAVFTGEHLNRCFPSNDDNGMLALGFEMNATKAKAFGEFTGGHLHRRMAIVLDNEIQSAPNLNGRIEDHGIIMGGVKGFTQDEVKNLKTVLDSGSLKVAPTLMSKATLGPSLGEASIRRGIIAGIVASIAVVLFIYFFYGVVVGTITNATLVVGIFLLVGGLGFIGATLTLPGIAGIVLTVGMAVDQNILINERIREEREKGKTLAQAVKNGFERAFVTIFDSQATTFLTGAILYKFGSGPIKGFAVTLMIGIVTTMYAAIVGSKILFAVGLERDWFKDVKMKRVFANMNVPFTSYFKVFSIVTASLSILGLLWFLVDYDKLKGLDFAGGFQVHVRFQEPQTSGDVESAIHRHYASAQVVSMKDVAGSKSSSGAATDYLLKIRAETAAEGAPVAQDPRAEYLAKVREAFAGKLIVDGITGLDVATDAAAKTSTAKLTLNLSAPIDPAVIESRLRDRVALNSIAPATGAAPASTFAIQLGYGVETSADKVRADVVTALAKLPGGVSLSDPMPESNYIGPRVGKELANQAIIALFLSIVGIVIYIRMRFADMSWGLGACASLVHDVTMCLGAMALVHALGIVDVEMDLTTIGSLLTLVGYSINDTIVVFDRIRENVQRAPDRPLRESIDLSINQTLSRTILTASTVFIAVLVLFVVNYGQRNVIEGFAFIMLIGVVVGTYSSIYIASPLMLWLTDREAARKKAAEAAAVA